MGEKSPQDDSLEDFSDSGGGDQRPEGREKTPHHEARSFDDLHLSPPLLANVRGAQFESPSPVQVLALPRVLLGRDVLCQARSGTGKTAVFVLGVLQLLCETPGRFLVAVHTTELACQLLTEFERFSRGLGVSAGTPPDVHANVLIGTPSELLQSLGSDPGPVRGLVVDECDAIVSDRPLRTAFERLYSLFGSSIQVLMFTATLTPSTKSACLRFLNNPFLVIVDDPARLTLRGLQQFYISVREREKLACLSGILARLGICASKTGDLENQAIVFVKAPQNALFIEQAVQGARAIVPHMAPAERMHILASFRGCGFPVLATTDLLSRGIDVANVGCVVNWDMPSDPQTYLHRVGRAGRFESRGFAFNLLNGPRDGVRLNEIMDLYDIDIEEHSN